MGKVKTETAIISPSRAADLLRGNKNNRRVSPQLVERYARDMATGNWQCNGSGIILNGDGSLLDGQHRLMACMLAQVPFETVIVRGVNAQAMTTIDTGRTRRLGDVLRIAGEKNATVLASVLRLSFTLGNIRPGEQPLSGRLTPSTSELLDLLERYPEARDAARLASSKKSSQGGPSQASVGTLALNLIVHVDDPEFMASFFSAALQGNGDPTRAAYSLWHANVKRAATANFRPESSFWLALLIKAWNAEITGKTVSLWVYRRAGSSAEKFPVLLDLDGAPITPVK
jgi:hypothetical protein